MSTYVENGEWDLRGEGLCLPIKYQNYLYVFEICVLLVFLNKPLVGCGLAIWPQRMYYPN